jgi:hypothetical protein
MCFVKVHAQASGLSKATSSVNVHVAYRERIATFGHRGFSPIRC